MKKLRFVNSKKDPNLGFNEEEITLLCKETGYEFPEIYLNFLRVAGKRSNIFSTDSLTIQDLINKQIEFKNAALKYGEIKDFTGLWCFGNNTSNHHPNYYFLKLNKQSNPLVYSYSNNTYPIDNGHNNELVGLTERSPFVEFINNETERKFGASFLNSIVSYILMVLFLPLWLPFLIYLTIKAKMR